MALTGDHHRHRDTALPLVLIHGGLWEDMDADRFWVRTGIAASLTDATHTVIAPDRLHHAAGWQAEVEHLSALLADGPVMLVAGSNGCTPATRLALASPRRVSRLLLAWPATAGDPDVDARTRSAMVRAGATREITDALLTGETLRGVRDEELTRLDLPVGVMPSSGRNPSHQHHTVDRLLRLLPNAIRLPACPEPPHPEFSGHLPRFAAAVRGFLDG